MKSIQKMGAWLSAAAGLLALAVAVTFWAFAQIEVAADARKNSFVEIRSASELLSQLRDAETDQRGYTLTGDETFLVSYAGAGKKVKGHLTDLRAMSTSPAADGQLDKLEPLIDAKLAEMTHVIELRRNRGAAAALALVESGLGQRLMDSIHHEMQVFIQTEEASLAQHDATLQLNLRRLFAILIAASVLTLLSAMAFAYLIYQKSQQRIRNLVHLETRRLLDLQEQTNSQLHVSNLALQEGEEQLSVTLSSIGDAVIATDSAARVTLINPVAELLTGWTLEQARGQLVDDIFQIINKDTRLPVTLPIMAALKHGAVQGLANHTVLISRDGSESDIADSCAPIRNNEGLVIGAVLVFRDVSKEYAVQQALSIQHVELESQNTELRQSQVALDILRARYFDLYDLAPVGYCSLNELGLIMEANLTAAILVGLTRGAMVKQWFSRFICAPDADTFQMMRKKVLDSGEPQDCEIRMLKSDGSQFWVHLAASATQDEGAPVIRVVLSNIDERKQAEQALLKAGALQSAIFNSANFSSIATDANGVIQIFNVGAERMLGYTAVEVVNKITPADISDPQEVIARAKALSIELETAIAPGFEALVFKASRGIEDIYELTYIRKDGSRFPAVVSVTALRDDQDVIIGYLLIGTDNTARKLAEEALRQAGALQSAIFNSANFSSIATDANGVIQIFNVGAERMLGYAAADVVNQTTPADISDPKELIERAQSLSSELGTPIAQGFEALVFKASRGIEDIYELTYIRKDGSRFPALVSVTALRDAQDCIIGYLLIGTDNTARQRIEAERARLDEALQNKNTELESAMLTAEQANLAKSDFLSSMSHELRTPLSAILGFAQLLESGTPTLTPVQKRGIDQILKAGWYLLELINEILDLAMIESGKLSLSMEPVLLEDVMRECQTMVEPQAQSRDIHVSFRHLEPRYFVHADRTRVKQVLINLLSNAVKYNRVGGTVLVDYCLSPPDAMRISVRDTGDGLSPQQLSQLFQPFNRLGQKSKVEEGTGIGLVVCKRLVELMYGKIGCESTVGEGSVFWFEIGLANQPELDDMVADLNLAVPTESSDMALSHTLLYVEDNPANLMLVEDLITRRPDIRLLTAKDANRGIALARAALPDVILMDINLPGISGLKALSLLRQDPVTAHIPVLALSANAIPRDIEKGLEAGFFRYLTKPIKVTEFMDNLDLAMQLADRQAELKNSKEENP